MTKITPTAFNRKFEQDKFGQGALRDKPIEAVHGVLGDCARCFKPIYVSPGQIVKRDKDGGFSHKACRRKSYYGE